MKKYVCDVCGWVYDPEIGDPDSGILFPSNKICLLIILASTKAPKALYTVDRLICRVFLSYVVNQHMWKLVL